MPELPEVETLRRALEKEIVGKTIHNIEITYGKIFRDDPDQIIGAKVQSVHRRAKLLWLEFANGKSLVIHLKLTGQLIYTHNGLESGPEGAPLGGGVVGGHPEKIYDQIPPHKHTHVSIEFTDRSHLYFNDLRKFGWMKIVPKGQEEQVMGGELGVEPYSKDYTAENLRARAARRGKMYIKQFLMDQGIIAGIGNIYSDEILFCASVHPLRRVADVKPREWQQIIKCTPDILDKSLKVGGTSFSSFRSLSGSMGKFYEIAKVYHKTGKPCPNKCGHMVERQKMGGRSAHFCSQCQV